MTMTMTILLILLASIVVTLFTLRFFAVLSPYDNPCELRDKEPDCPLCDSHLLEEELLLLCTRCGEEQGFEEIVERGGSWVDDGYTHTDGEVFCPSCFGDKDKYGEPYKSDQAEMIANPTNYLPRGY